MVQLMIDMPFTPIPGEIYLTKTSALPTFTCGALVKVLEVESEDTTISDVCFVQLLFGEVVEPNFYHACKGGYAVKFDELEDITDADYAPVQHR